MIKRLVKHVTFPLIARREGLAGVMRCVASLEESQFWPPERIRELQNRRLKRLLVHAYENTAFYKKRFDEAGFNPYAFRDADELTGIPILTKEQIRSSIDALKARTFSPGELHYAETGGTSDVKMRFFRDNRSMPMKEAAVYRFNRWAGWDFGDHLGMVWPAHQDFIGHHTLKHRVRNELYQRNVLFPAALIDEKACEDYLKRFEKKRPTAILAFSSPIYELARYMAKKGVDGHRIRGLITTGEPLYDHQRRLASDVFCCRVLDSYRTREVGPIAQECGEGSGMHINAECLYVELDGARRLAESGERAGSVIVTDLLNYGMPFIRYHMADMAVMSGRSCPCGRGLPLIDRIVGRALDVFVTPEGKLVSTIALVMYMVNAAPGFFGKMQIIQDARDHLTLKMTRNPIPGPEVTAHQKSVAARIFGPHMRMTYEFVDDIPCEKSGKYLFAKRLIPIPEQG